MSTLRFDLDVRRENVVVRDDDHFRGSQTLRLLAEFALEHADGARPAHVVRHQNVGVDPDVVAGFDPCPSTRARENFFRESHAMTAPCRPRETIPPNRGAGNVN